LPAGTSTDLETEGFGPHERVIMNENSVIEQMEIHRKSLHRIHAKLTEAVAETAGLRFPHTIDVKINRVRNEVKGYIQDITYTLKEHKAKKEGN
jgi:hypothetical protein